MPWTGELYTYLASTFLVGLTGWTQNFFSVPEVGGRFSDQNIIFNTPGQGEMTKTLSLLLIRITFLWGLPKGSSSFWYLEFQVWPKIGGTMSWVLKSVVLWCVCMYAHHRQATAFQSNSGTCLPDTECHITGDFILKTTNHLHPDNGKLENVEYFYYVCSMTTNSARYTHESNPGLPWQKQHSTRRRLFSPANWNYI
jgi:hypothetical protein